MNTTRLNTSQSGFTLIELVMVIVILGILAAVAVPKFADLSTDAKVAAAKGIAGSLSSASATNKAMCAMPNAATNDACVTATACADGGKLLQGDLPDGYVLGGSAPACTVTYGTETGTKADWTLVAATKPAS